MNSAFRLPILVFLAPLALAACDSATGPESGTSETVAVEPDYHNMGAKEVALIAHSHGRARRVGDDLIIAFSNGQTRTFHNDNKGCEDGPDSCDSFVLAADLPQFHWFLVYEGFYEGGRFTLYDDRGGLPTEIPYWPVFSPDGQRILIQNDDVSSEFPGDNLEIWRRQGAKAVREWSANPDAGDTGVSQGGPPYHSEVQRWRGDRVALIFSVPDAYDLKTRTSASGRKWTATLTRQADGWHLNARAPKQ
ncbi:MAG TPA: hypothetical protein VNW15_03400 [Rhizomicrobium sp.]|jgi:hypothetical protein|nr:hypothetical protein [Rhizomicrobium sp.]